MLITRFAYGSLAAKEFLTVFSQISQRASQLIVTHPGWADIQQKLVAAVAQLDANYKTTLRNDLTADIAAADTERDTAIDNLINILRAFAKTGEPNAVFAVNVATRYGFSSTMQMDTESTLIHQMKQEFDAHNISFAAIGCEPLWQQALTATDRLDQLLVQRDDSRVGQVIGRLRADREIVAAAWQRALDYLEALQIIAPEASVGEWIASLNAYIDRVRKQITHQATTGTVADGSVTILDPSGSQPSKPVTNPDPNPGTTTDPGTDPNPGGDTDGDGGWTHDGIAEW